jgi:hypothetical protein
LVAAEGNDGIAVCYAVIEYSNDGTLLWTDVLAGSDYSGGYVPQLARDAAGDVFVVGGTPGAGVGSSSYEILKLVWCN